VTERDGSGGVDDCCILADGEHELTGRLRKRRRIHRARTPILKMRARADKLSGVER
jgi:hypothetical protein